MKTTPKLGTAELLYQCAVKMGLKPAWVIPGGLFAITTDSGQHYVNSECSVLNSHVSVSLARNKYFTRLILQRHQLPNIPFARPSSLQEAQEFLAEHGKIIVKPVSGAGSRDIYIVEDADQLAGMNLRKCILEKYIVGNEMRYLIFNDTVVAVHWSEYGTSVEATRTLQRISYPHDAWDPTLTAMSLKIAGILGLKLAAVDFLIDKEGKTHILEVNAAPGLKWFHAPTSGPPVDLARLFLEAMLEDDVPSDEHSSDPRPMNLGNRNYAQI